MIGKPWKANTPTPRTPSAARRERYDHVLGLPYRLIALALVAIVIGATALVYSTWRELEERQRIVAEERERFADFLASRETAFDQLAPLSSGNQQSLRRSLNPQHVQAAQRLGIQPVRDRDQLAGRVARNELIRLTESPTYWLSRMSYSVPYATPDGAAALEAIGERFQERMAALDLPPFQFNVTSVLRTNQDQARLRRVNVNAARGASSHEFGTTFDLHYARFRYAADARTEIAQALGPLPFDFLYDEFARDLEKLYQRMAQEHVARIGAELGRALIDLENAGKLLALREVRQPVYHVTVARRIAS